MWCFQQLCDRSFDYLLKIFPNLAAMNLIYLLSLWPRNLNKAWLGNSPVPQLSTEVTQGFELVVKRVWRIQGGFIPMPRMLGQLEEWDLRGQSTEMLTDSLSSLVISAQSDFLNGISELPPSQEVDADHLKASAQKLAHSIMLSSAIFYHLKQSRSPLRFTGLISCWEECLRMCGPT